MIRKAIIVLLSLASLLTAAAWGLSYHRVRLRQFESTAPPTGSIPAGSITFVSVCLVDGLAYFDYARAPVGPITGEAAKELRGQFRLGFSAGTMEGRVRRAMSVLYTPVRWRPDIKRIGTTITMCSLPLWPMFVLFAAYPAVAFIRGPLRRWRRRRKGLCTACGYDLTGNVSGVCPECGSDIERV
jgi:hypothetical protein